MEYNFREIEENWQKYWADNKTFKAENTSDKPKFFVLDMFPYPSGAGLHVGHPLGYIASDIYARYKRHKGFNVMHPQGYDSFGLPAEQYAIQTGQHPAVTTAANVKTYRKQLDKIGFSLIQISAIVLGSFSGDCFDLLKCRILPSLLCLSINTRCKNFHSNTHDMYLLHK